MSVEKDDLYILILAAGESKRLGTAKQLLEFQGQTLLERVVQFAQNLVNNRVIVALGANRQEIYSQISLNGIKEVSNQNWQEGIASSIRCGIEALSSSANAVMILLCDQPLVTQEHLEKIIALWLQNPDSIIACRYQENIGPPAIFPSKFFDELLALQGDVGAKSLLIKYSDWVKTLSVPEAGFDVDLLEDWHKINCPSSVISLV